MSRVDADVEGVSERAIWSSVPDALWTSWTWQQKHRIRTLEALEEVIRVTDDERTAIRGSASRFRMAISPYYAALMDPDDPSCGIRQQAVPQLAELASSPHDLVDPLGEEAHMPVPGLTHRYPDRALLYLTHHCPVYCRHCTRKRKVSDPASAATAQQVAKAIQYIAGHPDIRDVLLSGGDPMTLGDDKLMGIVARVRAVGHVEVIRLCTRNPVTLPFRFTPALLERLSQSHPLLLHTHFNHPRECTPEAARCLRALADAGVSTANQMVLLKGINDDVEQIRYVNRWLLRQRCRPYYLLQADLAEGISHFRTPVSTGLEIMRELRGHTSGMAVPQYVIDAPGGGGKVPLLPDYGLEEVDGFLHFRNYLGVAYRYPLD